MIRNMKLIVSLATCSVMPVVRFWREDILMNTELMRVLTGRLLVLSVGVTFYIVISRYEFISSDFKFAPGIYR